MMPNIYDTPAVRAKITNMLNMLSLVIALITLSNYRSKKFTHCISFVIRSTHKLRRVLYSTERIATRLSI